jgi:hypothetical protein
VAKKSGFKDKNKPPSPPNVCGFGQRKDLNTFIADLCALGGSFFNILLGSIALGYGQT